MPPKPKFSKDDIVNAAFEIARGQGMSALTAREVGKRLGTSSSPIFTVFDDMEQLRTAVIKKAWNMFYDYMAVAEDYYPSYKMRGIQWVNFSRDEPLLFRAIFMQHPDERGNFDRVMQIIPFGKEKDVEIIMRDYHASRLQAEQMFRQMWIYTYGLCVLCATGVCTFTDEEITSQLGEIFGGMVYVIKHPGGNTAVIPEKNDSEASRQNIQNSPDFRQ